MSSSRSFVTAEQLKIFHSIDRRLYSILISSLGRDPSEAMHVVALLIWLERKGFRKLVYKALFLSYPRINQLVDELLSCLRCIRYGQFASSPDLIFDDIPLLRCIAEQDISLGLLLENRAAAREGVAQAMNNVCREVLSDIVPIMFGTTRNANNNPFQQPPFVSSGSGSVQTMIDPDQTVQQQPQSEQAGSLSPGDGPTRP